MFKSIVVMQIDVTRLVGKSKMSRKMDIHTSTPFGSNAPTRTRTPPSGPKLAGMDMIARLLGLGLAVQMKYADWDQAIRTADTPAVAKSPKTLNQKSDYD